ncbi:MAG: class I SAM-dependent methyltransferase [Acidobacteriota bacterium]
MEKLTDWNALWRELVELKERSHGEGLTDSWCRKASDFKESVKRRWKTPDSSREFILSRVNPDSTVLDIGAGTGAWAGLLAPHVKSVTAVEPSPSMIEIMRESLQEEGITNVDIVEGAWPDVRVKAHDFSLCSHAMYGYPDLPAFIRRMVAHTKNTCFLLLRATSPNGIRSEAAQHIWGQPLDSPNFTIAYNILLQMDIYADVLMEDTGFWKPRKSESLEEAFYSVKRYLGLKQEIKYDEYIQRLIERKLVFKDGLYFWPPEVRSALVYWRTFPMFEESIRKP